MDNADVKRLGKLSVQLLFIDQIIDQLADRSHLGPDIVDITIPRIRDMVVNIDCLRRCGKIFLRLAEPLITAVERQKDIEGSLLREAAVDLLKAFQLLKYLCGLLKDRITLYGAEQDVGAYGYDVVQGSTETVAKHYITNNIAEPTDPNRKVIGFTVAADQNRGLAEDTYMSRFEFLSDLEEKVCKNGGIGYGITVDLAKNAIIFDVLPIVDKTESQSERNRVVFAVERRNVLSLTHEFGATNSKNVFYATKSGGTLEADATTIMVADGDTAASGIDRREMQLNVSCDSISEVSKYALKDVENYRETESFEVSPADLSEYGKVYSVGDKVTVRSTLYGITMDAVITEAEKSVTSTGRTIAVTLGEAKPKPLDQIYQAIENKGV